MKESPGFYWMLIVYRNSDQMYSIYSIYCNIFAKVSYIGLQLVASCNTVVNAQTLCRQCQGSCKIALDVGGVFNTHREPQQPIANP